MTVVMVEVEQVVLWSEGRECLCEGEEGWHLSVSGARTWRYKDQDQAGGHTGRQTRSSRGFGSTRRGMEYTTIPTHYQPRLSIIPW